MSLRIRNRLGTLGLNTRILLLVGLLVVCTITLTTVMVRWSTLHIVESAIGEQMIVQARIAAHLVAIAEQKRDHPMTAAEINRELAEVTRFAHQQRGYDYEFWVTDPSGRVYLGTVPTEFTFSEDQEQAGVFLRLLDGHPGHTDAIVQASQKRQIDSHRFKYVGVSGVDKPRIVEVGYRTDSLLRTLVIDSALQAAGVAALVLGAGFGAYSIIRRLLTVPLNQIIRAAKEVENETYTPGGLTEVAARRDELGRLARVFEDTVSRLAAKYDSLVNMMQSVVLKVRGDGVIAFANAYASELFELPGSELVGQPLTRIVPEEWREPVEHRLRSLGADETQSSQVNENVSRSGRRYWMAWTNRVIKTGEGADKEVLCVGNDVTAETRQKQALERSEEQFRALLEAAPDALIISDEEGRITLVNAQTERILGYRRQELIGQPVEMLVPRRNREAHPALRRRYLTGATVRPMGSGMELAAVRKDGAEFPVEVSLSPLKSPDGAGTLVCSSLRDITERKRAEDELRAAKARAEEATKAKSVFLATMSHEIRTPMNGIIGMTELALDTDLTAEQRDYLTTVKSSADALLTIINDILDFSKIEAGRIELDPVEFLLRDALADTLGPLALRASTKGVELAYEVHPDVPDALFGDIHRIRQVIVNLVGNAVKFTSQGEVVLSVRLLERAPESLVLEVAVRDTGIGIDPAAAQKLFRAFQQAETSTTRKYGGTGLGLAISRQLVELMGGQIRLDSTPGVGSTFTFSVRLRPGVARPAPTAADAAELLAGKTALIIDDNSTNRRIVETMLRHWGLQSVSADSGPAALAMLDRSESAGRPLALIITDLHMPGMDGFELARAVRARPATAGTPIIMLTSSASTGDQALGAEVGLAARLIKPVKQSLLLDNILRTLGGASQRESAPAPREVAPAEGRALRILLAEDNAVNQKFAVRLLTGAGHEVVVANNGREAVDRWASRPFDVVLMDVQMPELDGLDATREIRGREAGSGRRTPIIAMTANAMEGDREMCLQAGMDGYVAKPVKKELLFTELSRLTKGDAGADHV